LKIRYENNDILKNGSSKQGVEKIYLSNGINKSISNFRETIPLKSRKINAEYELPKYKYFKYPNSIFDINIRENNLICKSNADTKLFKISPLASFITLFL
jgi:hypothetical protein